MASEKSIGLDVTKLGLAQLTQLKQQLDSEIDLFGTSLQQLKIAQGKFQESNECLEKLGQDCQGKNMLVPLTDSMYVPGELLDVNSVLIDVGTGYYVEKGIPAARDYFKRKVKFVSTQMDKVQQIAKEKLVLRDVVIEAIESKLQATLAAQQLASTGKS